MGRWGGGSDTALLLAEVGIIDPGRQQKVWITKSLFYNLSQKIEDKGRGEKPRTANRFYELNFSWHYDEEVDAEA